jgi:multicomponent Na+:H+ antiporter subunit G
MTEVFSGLVDLISWIFMLGGLFFFTTGALGLIRFPDIYTRLHAVTKADNVGLGLLSAGLLMQAPSLQAGLLMVLIWLLAIASAATSCQLLARYSQEQQAADESAEEVGNA